MYIREATSDDDQELQALQARCPMGTTIVVSTVNSPDFFSRAKAYEWYKVYVACEDGQIIGSAACATRDALLNEGIGRVGYEFQYFTSPEYRGEGVATVLHQHIEKALIQRGAKLSYLVVIEGNTPAMQLFEGLGFNLYRTLVMPSLVVYRRMGKDSSVGNIRSATTDDLGLIADLLNETWEGAQLYEPRTAEGLSRFIHRMPAFDLDNLLILENQGDVSACLGYWDWSKITRITVKSLSPRMRLIGWLLDVARLFKPTFQPIKPGAALKQVVLTPIAFRTPDHLAVLLKQVNDLCLDQGIGQIFCASEQDHALLDGLGGFVRIDTAVHLYVKSFQSNILADETSIFMDGRDL